MTEANDAVLEMLDYALMDINYNLSEELHGFWYGWIRDGHREAVEKGYDY